MLRNELYSNLLVAKNSSFVWTVLLELSAIPPEVKQEHLDEPRETASPQNESGSAISRTNRSNFMPCVSWTCQYTPFFPLYWACQWQGEMWLLVSHGSTSLPSCAVLGRGGWRGQRAQCSKGTSLGLTAFFAGVQGFDPGRIFFFHLTSLERIQSSKVLHL